MHRITMPRVLLELVPVGMLFLLCSFSSTALAQSNEAVVSQGYQTHVTTLTAGELVSTLAADHSQVQPANSTMADLLVGVVTDRPLVALSDGTQSVQVATGGTTAVFVSDINGTVRAGDKITASSINGIGMRATSSAEVVGTLQADLSSVKTVPFTVTDTAGKKRTVHIGLLPVRIAVSYYGTTVNDAASSIIPSGVQRIANAIAGHDVPVLRVLVCLVILLLGLVSTVVILYASVRSSITSVGRNPLAASAIHKSLLQVVLLVVGIMVAMLAGAYIALAI